MSDSSSGGDEYSGDPTLAYAVERAIFIAFEVIMVFAMVSQFMAIRVVLSGKDIVQVKKNFLYLTCAMVVMFAPRIVDPSGVYGLVPLAVTNFFHDNVTATTMYCFAIYVHSVLNAMYQQIRNRGTLNEQKRVLQVSRYLWGVLAVINHISMFVTNVAIIVLGHHDTKIITIFQVKQGVFMCVVMAMAVTASYPLFKLHRSVNAFLSEAQANHNRSLANKTAIPSSLQLAHAAGAGAGTGTGPAGANNHGGMTPKTGTSNGTGHHNGNNSGRTGGNSTAGRPAAGGGGGPSSPLAQSTPTATAAPSPSMGGGSGSSPAGLAQIRSGMRKLYIFSVMSYLITIAVTLLVLPPLITGIDVAVASPIADPESYSLQLQLLGYIEMGVLTLFTWYLWMPPRFTRWGQCLEAARNRKGSSAEQYVAGSQTGPAAGRGTKNIGTANIRGGGPILVQASVRTGANGAFTAFNTAANGATTPVNHSRTGGMFAGGGSPPFPRAASGGKPAIIQARHSIVGPGGGGGGGSGATSPVLPHVPVLVRSGTSTTTAMTALTHTMTVTPASVIAAAANRSSWRNPVTGVSINLSGLSASTRNAIIAREMAANAAAASGQPIVTSGGAGNGGTDSRRSSRGTNPISPGAATTIAASGTVSPGRGTLKDLAASRPGYAMPLSGGSREVSPRVSPRGSPKGPTSPPSPNNGFAGVPPLHPSGLGTAPPQPITTTSNQVVSIAPPGVTRRQTPPRRAPSTLSHPQPLMDDGPGGGFAPSTQSTSAPLLFGSTIVRRGSPTNLAPLLAQSFATANSDAISQPPISQPLAIVTRHSSDSPALNGTPGILASPTNVALDSLRSAAYAAGANELVPPRGSGSTANPTITVATTTTDKIPAPTGAAGDAHTPSSASPLLPVPGTSDTP